MIDAAAMQATPRAPMSALASIGATGGNLVHAQRDLDRKLNTGSADEFVAKPLMPTLPLWDATARPLEKTLLQSPVILPHEWFAMMYAHSLAEFDKFVESAAKIDEFWTRVEENSGCWKVIQSNVFPSSTLPYPSQKSRRWRPPLARPRASLSTSCDAAP